MSRLDDLRRLYAALDDLALRVGGPRTLAECSSRLAWPERGVYFFFEAGEIRSDTGDGLRVVRVGTHALTAGSRSSLWQRLSQHRGGKRSGGGNHRGSIFRHLIGSALKHRPEFNAIASWGVKSDAGAAARHLALDPAALQRSELPLELAVSSYIRSMPFLVLAIGDAAAPESDRGLIERNSIALLSNFRKAPFDPPSAAWLGHRCDRIRVQSSGLWNNNHVDDTYDPGFLEVFEHYVGRSRSV
jgi:hypothetical protein